MQEKRIIVRARVASDGGAVGNARAKLTTECYLDAQICYHSAIAELEKRVAACQRVKSIVAEQVTKSLHRQQPASLTTLALSNLSIRCFC